MANSYSFELENIAKILAPKKQEAGQRVGGNMKTQLRALFERRYRAGKNQWFFSKLRF